MGGPADVGHVPGLGQVAEPHPAGPRRQRGVGEPLDQSGLAGSADPEHADQPRAVVDQVDTEEYRLLPFRSPAALEVYRYADGSTKDGVRTIGIEWDDELPMVFTGRWVAHEDIRLDDEGAEW